MILQISSGQGPLECEYAVFHLANDLQREYPQLEVIFSASGRKKGCFSCIKLESSVDISDLEGSVLWICQSPYRPQYKRKNWYVDLSIIHESEAIELGNQIRTDTFHSGGKGGQNVNKVETGVRITHLPTGLSASSTTARSQHMNRKLAMNRLCEMLSELQLKNKEMEKNLAWMEHNRIIRGNPIRTYTGLDFKRKD